MKREEKRRKERIKEKKREERIKEKRREEAIDQILINFNEINKSIQVLISICACTNMNTSLLQYPYQFK